MNKEKGINIKDFDYQLPDERIAKFPLKERDRSKMLVYRNGVISESVFNQLPDYLPPKSLTVFNDTKVIQARLLFNKASGARIEVFCLEPHTPHDYYQNFQSRGGCAWKCLVGNLKRWKSGVLTQPVQIGKDLLNLTAEKSDNQSIIVFKWDSQAYTFADILDAVGVLPIPPYLHRRTEASDLFDYQTVYSRVKGSVAAPTAGLHFTDDVLNEFNSRCLTTDKITLHVGAGTFKPVQTETLGEHEMHPEFFSVKRSTIVNLINYCGNITAVGTTTVRTLESLYYSGLSLKHNKTHYPLEIRQWEPYDNPCPDIPPQEALQALLDYLDANGLEQLTATTRIIIVPGYRFRLINRLLTNFHQPQSTLLLLVSAFIGDDWRKVYDYALSHHFRFLSYGDCSLLFATPAAPQR